MKKVLTSSALAALAVLAATSMSYAANTTGQGDDNMITVTATRTQQLVKAVPADTYIVSQKEIQDRQYKTLQDALGAVPGVELGVDPHGGMTASIRGADPRHTLILVDGIPTNTELSGARANASTFNRLTMDNVQRIEVLEGASSALYGSEAIGGVINIITKGEGKAGGTINIQSTVRDHDARWSGYDATLSLHTGQVGKMAADLIVGKNRQTVPLVDGLDGSMSGPRTPFHVGVTYKADKNNKLAYSLDGIKEHISQYGIGGGPSFSVVHESYTRMQSLEYTGKLGDTNVMMRGFTTHNSDVSLLGASEGFLKMMMGGGPGGHGGHGGPSSGGSHPGAAPTGDPASHGAADGQPPAGHPAANGNGAAGNGAGQPAGENAHPGGAPAHAHGGMPPLSMMFPVLLPGYYFFSWDGTGIDRTAFEMQLDTPMGDNHLLTYGFQVKDVKAIGTRILTDKKAWTRTIMGKVKTAHEANMTHKAFYLQDMWQVTPSLLLIPAVRVDMSSKFSSRVSPKLGITYNVDPTTRIKFNAGAGYALPGITEMYHHWEMYPGSMFVGNPNLKPETSQTYDFALEKDVPQGTLKVGMFHQVLKDYIQIGVALNADGTRLKLPSPTVPGMMDKISSYYNVTNAVMNGAEASMTMHPNEHLDIFGSVTLLRAEDSDTHKRLADKPLATYTGGFNLHDQAWNLSFWGNYETGRITYDEKTGKSEEQPNVGVWNVMLTYHANAQTRLYAGVNNLFNTVDSGRDLDGQVYRMGVEMKF